MTQKKRIVVGISGASGAPLARRCLEILDGLDGFETCLVATKGARKTIEFEDSRPFSYYENLANTTFEIDDIGASIASGTFKTEGMIIVPCSMKTAAGIRSGYSDNLLLRAADVTLKEKRPLVLMTRETPLSTVHLDNLAYLSTLPSVHIIPPMLTYYINPTSIAEIEYHLLAKALERFNIELPNFYRWTEAAHTDNEAGGHYPGQ